MTMENRYDRFKGDASFTKRDLHIGVIGIGGIGSNLMYLLSRLGNYNYYIYEVPNHTLEEHNFGGQMYPNIYVGDTKQNAIKHIMAEFGSFNAINHMGRFEGDSMILPIMFVGPDNITTRKIAFEKWVDMIDNIDDEKKKECIFIDGRLELWQGFAYTVLPNEISIKRYRETLFDEKDAFVPKCSMKQTNSSAFILTGYMVAHFCNWLANYNLGEYEREVPFSVFFNIQNNINEIKL